MQDWTKRDGNLCADFMSATTFYEIVFRHGLPELGTLKLFNTFFYLHTVAAANYISE